jgi:prepilin-type N-terminal cleavage/methylation domain-containing protein
MRAARGFTLIELMIITAVIGICIVFFTPMLIQIQRLAESEVGLQRAHLALGSEVEALRAMAPGDQLRDGNTIEFSGEDWGLVEGKGRATVEEVPDRPGLFRVRVEINWIDAVKGQRSIHTMVYRAR